MAKFQMPGTDEKPEFVKENFNRIADKYDRFNDWNSFYLHRAWKNALVREMIRYNPQEVLDLCCGTGDIAYRIARQPSIKKLFAVDFSPSMLSVAQVRLENWAKENSEESSDRVRTMVGDAMYLKDFGNESLDAVSIGFGLRNVQNLRLCLQEIYRVLKPGGVYLNLDVGKVKNPVIRFFANFYFFRIVPIFGYLLWGGKNEMFDYLPESSLHYPGQDELKSILEEEGFTQVRYRNFVFGNACLHIAEKNH